MASSSRTPKGRKGKQVMRDDEDDNHDPYRFFTNFHEKFFLSYVASKAIIPSTKFKLQKGQYRDVKRQILMHGWVKLGKPKKNISATLVREFYANARKNPDVEDSREFRTFVRGVSFGFSKERIRDLLELRGPLDSETSFNVRKLRSNRDTDATLRDICVEGAPTSNQSEVTVERAVLIHCIITSQEVELEEIIEDTMANIISKLHLSKPPLAFPNIIACLLEDSGVDYHALDSGDKVPKGRPITAEVMENIRQPQRHSPPPHQTPQPHQFHEQPFPPSPQLLYSHGSDAHRIKSREGYDNKDERSCRGLSLDSRANDMYTHWGLQQCIPNYGPTNLEDIPQIPHKIRDNFIFGKPWHEGLIRPTQLGESSTPPQQQAPPQQAPPEANAPRRENPDSDDE
ncbi:hypothetical protein PIB30_103604 [Stylosanthes scabra]|uniref:Putative plant transposon protein domain-containing protein n=1 Tax=Stylosanthes scabra TaxID=79078 RepID=A0ABU6YYQ6_9FABA|nr:hypothetical protein [Stylosanthes scabra]